MFVLIADVGCCFRGLNSFRCVGVGVIVVMCQWKQNNGQSTGGGEQTGSKLDASQTTPRNEQCVLHMLII